MNHFCNTFLSFIAHQFKNEENTAKRLIIQDIPRFIQQVVHAVHKRSEYSSLPIVFTNSEDDNVKEVINSDITSDLLLKRNEYATLNLAIVADISLDRSNATSVTILNEYLTDKWRWIDSPLGHHFMNAIYAGNESLDKEQKSLIHDVFVHIGKCYDAGVEGQWLVLQRLFQVVNKGFDSLTIG